VAVYVAGGAARANQKIKNRKSQKLEIANFEKSQKRKIGKLAENSERTSASWPTTELVAKRSERKGKK
jgi:hypothetical protein